MAAAEQAINIMGQVFTVFWIIMGMVLLVAIWFFFAIVKKFKYKVRIREVVNGRKIIFDDKARLIKKDGQEYWKLMKLKDLIPIPPADVIDIDNKGKRVVELYRTEKGEHMWCKENQSQVVDPGDIDWLKDHKVVNDFEPITMEERDFIINNLQRSEKRRGKKWTDQLPTIAGLAALVVIVVCLMIFYKDVAQPLLEMGDKYNQNQQIQLEIVEALERIDKKVQVLQSEQEFNENNPDRDTTPPR